MESSFSSKSAQFNHKKSTTNIRYMEIEVIDGIEWRRERYSNGKLSYEEPYVNGELHGLVRDWHENGQLAYATPYVNGQCRGWHKNGQLWYEQPYVNGQRHGLRRGWDENGQLWYIQLWNNDKLVFEIDNPPQTSDKWKLK